MSCSPNYWNEYFLKDITKFIDYRGKTPTKTTSGVRLITAKNVKKGFLSIDPKEYISEEEYALRQNRGIPQNGDVLFTTEAPLGNVAILDLNFKVSVGQRLITLRPDSEKLTAGFLFYLVLSPQFQNKLLELATGTTVKGIKASILKKTSIKSPPLPEQKRIVSKLDALFERIDRSIALLEENIKHTEALMASALDEVFGNGDTPIKDICQINPKKSEVKHLVEQRIKVSFLPMAELNEFSSDFTASQTKEISEVYKGYTYFKESDVLLAKVTPCFENGKAGISRSLVNGIGFGSSEFHVIRPNEKILPEWIYYSILTQRFRNAGVLEFTGSSGLKRVPAKFVGNWKISLPPIDEQKRIISRINEAISKLTQIKITYTAKQGNLKSLKESILDKAFKGEL